MWLRPEPDSVVLGVTAIQVALAGRLSIARAKPVGQEYEAGRSIGTLESPRFFGPIRTPVRALLVDVNDAVLKRPKVLTESPYSAGWFARLRPVNWSAEAARLRNVAELVGAFSETIHALRIRCFAAIPDHDLIEIGTECAAVLVKLNDLLAHIDVDDVVHIVSDDVTAPIEMERWSEETHQPIVDHRSEANLYHFLVRKVS